MSDDKDKKPKKEVVENIKDLAKLESEFVSGRMKERSVLALKAKLNELYSEDKIAPKELSLFVKVLKRDRKRNNITNAYTEILNREEIKRAKLSAIVKIENPPAVHYLIKDMNCKYYQDIDNDRVVVFVERKIPSEHQFSRELAVKRINKEPISQKELPAVKTLIHRIDITHSEFSAWFEPEFTDADIAADTSEDDDYEFDI